MGKTSQLHLTPFKYILIIDLRVFIDFWLKKNYYNKKYMLQTSVNSDMSVNTFISYFREPLYYCPKCSAAEFDVLEDINECLTIYCKFCKHKGMAGLDIHQAMYLWNKEARKKFGK